MRSPIVMTAEKDNVEFDSHTDAINAGGMYVLMGEIDAGSIKPVIEWLLHENFIIKRKQKELLLMICSEGGNISEAFALIDVMKSMPIPIKTVGLGSIASCGLMIFIAGSKGRRVLTPNTSILSHQFSWHSSGKVHELFATVKEFELTQQRMIEHYRECTELDDETIKKVLLPPQDVYLSAEEALNYKICDHVAQLKR
jgi:ATP-dependent Clp protease protease subunit